jgi:hypothetical protein
METKERTMQMKRMLLAASTAMVLSAAAAQAGPCNTSGTSANRDAGSGPTVGATGRTTGSAQSANQHPPTDTMNRATGGAATSSQDSQAQMQGQPTAGQQAQGVQPSAKTADNDC